MDMIIRRVIFFLFLVFFCGGCAVSSSDRSLAGGGFRESGKMIAREREKSFHLQNIQDKDLKEYVQKKGVVFAKTDFQGVLKTTYVKLLFEGQGEHNKNKFYLHIEDNPGDRSFFGQWKTVKPGYFFIELPAGPYKISSVGIPVGSTLATESIDVSFDVLPTAVVYMGTLKMVGTKEKIKLGGVPVIRPGFEYEAVILDEREEGARVFHQRYPQVPAEILTNLMRLNHQ